MALLNHLHAEPPDGWRYLQKETGVWIRAELHDELVDAVMAHRQHKGLPVGDKASVSLEIQRQICLGAEKCVCHAEKGENWQPFKDMARTLNLTKIAGLSETVVSWLKEGLRMVTPAESAARAAICRGCPFNRPVPNCVCTPFYAIIDKLIPKDRNEGGLYVCGICGCSLKAKILAPQDIVRQALDPDLRLPEWCWQN